MGPLLLPIAIGIGAIGVGASIYEGEKASSAQKQATQLQRQSVDFQAAMDKRNAIRQSRISAAQAQNTATVQGVSDSSSSQGGVASIQSQLDANLSFLDTQTTLADATSNKLGEAAIASSRASEFKSVAGFAFDVAGSAPAINKGVFNLFHPKGG